MIFGSSRQEQNETTRSSKTTKHATEEGGQSLDYYKYGHSVISEDMLSFLPKTFDEAQHYLLYRLSKYQSLYETRLIVECFPGCLDNSINEDGQTPVHVAAEMGVSCDVIRYMMMHIPQSCHIVDDMGKLPLHYASEPSKWVIPAGCGIFEDERDLQNILDPQYLPMIGQMCLLNTKAATLEDDDGMNPIEHALLDPFASRDVIRTLQRAASKHWKQSKQNSKRQDQSASGGVTAGSPIQPEDKRMVVTPSA